MTPARFRKLALAFEGVTEVPHFDRRAFRTARKIFATLGADGRVNLVVEPVDRREALLESIRRFDRFTVDMATLPVASQVIRAHAPAA